MGCYSADCAPLWSRDCTLLRSSLAEEGGWNEEVREMIDGIEEKDITSFPACQLQGSQLSSKSAQVQSPIDAMTLF